MQFVHRYRPDAIGSPENLGDYPRLSLLRDHVRHRQPACGGGELCLLPAVHVDEINLVEFVANHPLIRVPKNKGYRKNRIRRPTQAKLLSDHVTSRTEEQTHFFVVDVDTVSHHRDLCSQRTGSTNNQKRTQEESNSR
jgi:hypothetical protein